MSKDRTIPDTMDRFTKLRVESRILDILYGCDTLIPSCFVPLTVDRILSVPNGRFSFFSHRRGYPG